jgi:alkaline phosphatase
MPATSKLLLLLLLVSFLSIPQTPMIGSQQIDFAIPSADESLSIILMIGDGMGYQHVELARLVEFGEHGSLIMQDSDWNASVTTHSADAAVTDSAAAATAIATGNKTNNGLVSVSPSLVPLETILEYAQTQGKATGIVATCHLAHATPACFMTHVDSRDNYVEIARQIVEEAAVDVLLGGGSDYFSGSQISAMITNDYSVVYNRTELAKITSGKVFGLFSASHMDYEYDRDYAIQPSIAEMTNKSIEILSQDSDGFFLMVEGSRIDHAAHAEDTGRNALDTIAFDKAVDVALGYVETHNNTILIVTADHETEGLIVLSHNLSSELPSDLVAEDARRALRIERVNNVTVDWTATYHTNWSVPLFCCGTAFSDLTNDITIDNIDIYHLMKDFYLGNPLNGTQEPNTPPEPIEPTDPTDPTETTGETEPSTVSDTTTEPTHNPNSPLDSWILLAASAGVAIIILALVLITKKR